MKQGWETKRKRENKTLVFLHEIDSNRFHEPITLMRSKTLASTYDEHQKMKMSCYFFYCHTHDDSDDRSSGFLLFRSSIHQCLQYSNSDGP